MLDFRSIPFLGSTLTSGTRHESAEIQQYRALLQIKEDEVQSLRDEVTLNETEKDRLVIDNRRLTKMLEEQESEFLRFKEQVGSTGALGGTTQFWEEKYLTEERARKAVEALKRASEDKVIELQLEIQQLKAQFDEKASRRQSMAVKETVTTQFSRSDGPKGFMARLVRMKQSSTINLLVKDKYQLITVALSSDCTAILLANEGKKKPFEILPIENVDSVSYAPRAELKKVKANRDMGRNHMKFSVSMSDHRTFHFLALEHAQLVAWYLGLQNLTAKPGEEILTIGEFLWDKVRCKLVTEAADRGINPHAVVKDVFNKMIAPDTPVPAHDLTQIAEED
eukprot:c11691_g1_i1.p1 GENE.c11691_g1_i1~~c11691_g1_i1.p1  ORF type:complete len:338 (+),score=82.59 c11691_g1_i1:31-1044(+)